MISYKKGFGFFEILLSIAFISVLVSACIPTLRQHIVHEQLANTMNVLDIFHVAMNHEYQSKGTYANKSECGVALPASDTFEFSCKPTNGGRGFEVTAVSNGHKGIKGYQYSIDSQGNKMTKSFPNAKVPVDCWLAAEGSCSI